MSLVSENISNAYILEKSLSNEDLSILFYFLWC